MSEHDLPPSTDRTLYAIVFTDVNGQEWIDSTDENGNLNKFPHPPSSESDLPFCVDAYYMRETAEAMAGGRGEFRIIEVNEIISPVGHLIGYKILKNEEEETNNDR